MLGNFLLIYVCNFHVLSHLLLIYVCKLHLNLHRLQDVEGIPTVIFVSMHDLEQAQLNAVGDLVLGDNTISLIYSRYDFSHPNGTFDTNPNDDAVNSPVAWSSEWRTIEKIEQSNAIMSSNIGCRLAVRKRTHYALNRQGNSID
jgi:hypothetical protein